MGNPIIHFFDQPLFVVLAICNAALLKKRIKLLKKAYLELFPFRERHGPKTMFSFFSGDIKKKCVTRVLHTQQKKYVAYA